MFTKQLGLSLVLTACTRTPTPVPDLDGDGFPAAEDCDDEDPFVNPSAWDFDNDGVDADCDGEDGTGPLDVDRLPFQPTHLNALGVRPGSLLCDATNDGHLDLLAVRSTAGQVDVLVAEGPLHQPGPVHTHPLTFARPGLEVLLACGDFDGDGADDVVVADDLRVQVLYGPWPDRDAVRLHLSISDLALVDPDGDGTSTLVMLGDDLPASPWAIPGARLEAPLDANGLPGFAVPTESRARELLNLGPWASSPGVLGLRTDEGWWFIDDLASGTDDALHRFGPTGRSFTVGDFDGDGAIDDFLIAGDELLSLGVDAAEDFVLDDHYQYRLPNGHSVDIVNVGDLDGDGAEDVALGYSNGTLYLRVVSGRLASAQRARATNEISLLRADRDFDFGDLVALGKVDLDRDGRADLLMERVFDTAFPRGMGRFSGWLSSDGD